MSTDNSIKENKDFEEAKKWLKANGDFKTSIKEIIDGENKTAKVNYHISFLKTGSKNYIKDSGEDLKKLVIGMYLNER